MSNSLFPPLPGPTITEPEVIGVLVEIQNRGWDVRNDGERRYIVLRTEDEGTYVVQQPDGTWGVSPWHRTLKRAYSPTKCFNLTDLRTQLTPYLGEAPPERVRLVKEEPASNVAKLVALVGDRKVLAVYDPYCDDKGLDHLRAIGHLKPCLDPSLRILTKKPQQISKAFATAFCTEFKCDLANIHRMKDGHRRFWLLSEDKVLILGFSVNNPDHDEAAHLEADTQDKPFFETQWAASAAITW